MLLRGKEIEGKQENVHMWLAVSELMRGNTKGHEEERREMSERECFIISVVKAMMDETRENLFGCETTKADKSGEHRWVGEMRAVGEHSRRNR